MFANESRQFITVFHCIVVLNTKKFYKYNHEMVANLKTMKMHIRQRAIAFLTESSNMPLHIENDGKLILCWSLMEVHLFLKCVENYR